MNKPTFLSLFAGIGGIDLGLTRAGWQRDSSVQEVPPENTGQGKTMAQATFQNRE